MEEYRFEKKLFGKNIVIIFYNVSIVVIESIIDEIYIEAKRLEKIFNFYDKSSELSALNKKRDLSVSKDLLFVIKKAIKYSKLTNGEYDISLGKNILNRKSNKSLIKLNCSYKDIIIKDNKIKLKNNDVLIDLGSIAKGYIVDKLADFILNKGIEDFFIDARGDLKTIGNHFETIDIENPRKKDNIIATIKLKNLSIATSGDYNQYFDNFDNSHILNKKDLISVSVISKNLNDADVFASVIFLLDKKKRQEFISKNKIVALTIDKKLNTKEYNNFFSYK